ncbi:hypothetical protein ACFWVM_24825 [Nocardia fluminea]|uniref:hypothetical protein n=1 Tax=Nocardia fluminea TaxID=134984 RepID=UPI003655FD92
MAGTENPKIPPRTERPQALSHAEIIDSFAPVGVDPSFGAVAVFWQAKTDWEVGLATFRQRMHAAISEAWEGNAAEASKNAISAYTTKAEELTPTFETVARLISSSALSSSDTKSSIPARKDDPDIWDINDRWINNDEFEDGRNDDEEEARAIMKAKYVEAFGIVDAGLPVLDHPTSLVTESFVPGGDGDGGGDDGDGGGSDGGGSDDADEDDGTGDAPDTGGDEDTGDDDTTGDDTEDDTTDDGTTDEETEDDTTSDDDTAAAATESPVTTPGTNTPNTPGSPGSPSSPSGGSPSAGVPGAAVATPGRAVPGIPATAVTSAAATGSAAGAAGRGMAGAPGMMGAGAGRGGGKDDENTHETPDYLINEENTRELIGEIAKATPQAIGARFLSAQTRPAEPEGESK